MAYIYSQKYNGSANGVYAGLDDLSFKGWSKGVVNKYPLVSVPKDALVDALNVDIHDDGSVARRNGYKAILNNAIHSCWNNESQTLGFFVEENTLKCINSKEEITELKYGLNDLPLSYCEVNNEIYFSNGLESGKIRSDLSVDIWQLENPVNPPIVTIGGGDLPAGRYIVAYTYQYTDSETGSSPFVVVDVPDNSSLNIACDTISDYTVNIYISMTNGEELFQVDNDGNHSYIHNSYGNFGVELSDEILQPFPLDCSQLFYYKGRIYGVKYNGLYFTDELNYRMYNPMLNPYFFDSNIVLAASCQVGIYIATETSTYFLSGNDYEDWNQTKILPTSAIKGSLFRDTNAMQLGWLSHDGYILCDGQGGAKNMTSNYLDFSKNYTQASAIVMESNGVEKVVFSLNSKGNFSYNMSEDYIENKNDEV